MPAFRQIVSELRPQGRLNAGPAPKSLDLQPVVQGVTAVVDEELQRQHTEALMNSRTALNALELRLIHDPETGAAKLQGRAAIGSSKVVTEEWDKRVSEIGDTMPDRSRQAFMALAQARRNQVAEWAAGHERREGDVARAQDFQAGIQSSVGRAVSWAAAPARDPDEAALNAQKVAAEIVVGKGAILEYWKGKASTEFIDAELTKYTSAAHEAVIKNMQQRDPAAAMEYFKEHQKAISPLRWDEIGGPLIKSEAAQKVHAFGDEVAKNGLGEEESLALARERFPPGDIAREAAVAEVKTRFAESAAINARKAKQVSTDAWASLMKSGSMRQIPEALMSDVRKFAPEEERQMRDWVESKWHRAKSDAEGKKHEETPEAHLQYLGALRMATERPAEFAAMSDEALAKYQPLLTPQHYQQLIAMRTGINKDQAKAVQLGKLRKEALALVGSALPELKIKMEGAKRTPTEVARANAFDVALQDAILEAADKGPVDSKELRNITANLLRVGIEQGTGGWFSDPKKRLGFEIDAERASGEAKTYVAKPYDKIPPEQQRALVESLAKTKGLKRSIYGGDYVLTAEDKQEVERMYQRAVEAGRIKP